MSIAERLTRAARRLWKLPCKLMLATIVLCIGVREWYPVSPFPMYATFGPTAWYVCVTDAAGRPLPTGRYLGLDATMMRRMFESRVLAQLARGSARAAADAAAARETLESLVRDARPAPGAPPLPERIALQRIGVTRGDDRQIVRTYETLGVLGDP